MLAKNYVVYTSEFCQKNITQIWSIPIVSEPLIEVVPEMHHNKIFKLNHTQFK